MCFKARKLDFLGTRKSRLDAFLDWKFLLFSFFFFYNLLLFLISDTLRRHVRTARRNHTHIVFFSAAALYTNTLGIKINYGEDAGTTIKVVMKAPTVRRPACMCSHQIMAIIESIIYYNVFINKRMENDEDAFSLCFYNGQDFCWYFFREFYYFFFFIRNRPVSQPHMFCDK